MEEEILKVTEINDWGQDKDGVVGEEDLMKVKRTKISDALLHMKHLYIGNILL